MTNDHHVKSWQLIIDQNGIITLPADFIEETGWKEGDVLIYIDNKDGTYSIVKEDLTNFIKKGIIENEGDS